MWLCIWVYLGVLFVGGICFPWFQRLGLPVVPFTVSLLGEGSPTKVATEKKGTLILSSLLEDLAPHPKIHDP